ncbi:DUF5605 domain-containing protein [Pseudarthrobacter scleromae]|uniref:DUF5605 domain-containing protein n=1 Tax=Pseudarthrobacter scleromae TaxID=158897 RepID=UPI00363F5B02
MTEATLAYKIAGHEAGIRLLRDHAPEVLEDPKLTNLHSYPLGHVLEHTALLTGTPAREALLLGLSGIEDSPQPRETAQALPSRYEAPANTSQVQYQAETHVWDRFEIELGGPAEGNPVVNVMLEVIFISGGQSVRVPGFYDGESVYRVRFLVPFAGLWTFQTRSNIASLNEINGSFTASEPRPGSRGIVRVANKFHFEYTDGSPYRPIGTTAYSWIHQPAELVEQTLETLADGTFNKMRMCVFPKSYYLCENEPALYPFEGDPESGFDYTRLNFRFFQHLEAMVDRLDAMGIEADLILFHGYDRWGFSSMPAESDDLYVKHVVSRLASYRNVWWSLANEFDLMPGKRANDWERYADIVQQNDPTGHLLSIHNSIQFYNHSRPWVTHCSIQQNQFYLTAEETTRWREEWQKPIVIDECVYEGNIDRRWGNITGQELTRRFWEGAIRGGYVGHSETYAHPDDILWWAKGGELHGSSPSRIKFLADVLAESPNGYLEPLPQQDKVIAAGIPDQYEIMYFGFSQPIFWHLEKATETRFTVEIIDTWNMTIKALEGTYSGRFRVDLPGNQYIALRLRAVNTEGAG